LLRLSFFLILACVLPAFAEPGSPRAVEMMQQMQLQRPQNHPGWQLEWNNQAPQQRQALDNFYRSLQSLQMQQSMERLQREQSIEQLRDMSPQQRLQRFQDFVQHRGVEPSYR
jgi:hypothetical protein